MADTSSRMAAIGDWTHFFYEYVNNPSNSKGDTIKGVKLLVVENLGRSDFQQTNIYLAPDIQKELMRVIGINLMHMHELC